MPQNKRVRRPYCELPQEEKDRLNARRRALYAERRSRKENTLIPVEIQGEVSTEENIESSLGHSYVPENTWNDQDILHSYNPAATDSVALPSSSRNPAESMILTNSIYTLFNGKIAFTDIDLILDLSTLYRYAI